MDLKTDFCQWPGGQHREPCFGAPALHYAPLDSRCGGPTPTHQYLGQRSCCPPTFWPYTWKNRTKSNYIFSYNFSFYCPNHSAKTDENRSYVIHVRHLQ